MYEMGRIFRNEGVSTRHNPEFTSIELYQAYADYNDMMDLTEGMISKLCMDVNGKTKIVYQGVDIDLTPGWRRVSMNDLVKDKLGIDFYSMRGDLEGARAAAEKAGVPDVAKAASVGNILNLAFEEFCEADLIQPTFVTEHPVEISPLAKRHRTKEGLTERFELFCYGRELANAFSELTDPIDQRQRFELQAAKKAAGDLEAADVDEVGFVGVNTRSQRRNVGRYVDQVASGLRSSVVRKDNIVMRMLLVSDWRFGLAAGLFDGT